MAEIFSIVYKPRGLPSQPHDHYTRVPLESAQLVVGKGIKGDRKGGHPERQLNIMSYETLMQLAEQGFHVSPGAMGEQIIVKGLDVNALALGERIQLGNATVEVVKPRTGCERFEAIQGRSRMLAAGKMGIIAFVVAGGAIRVGDPVALVAPVAEG